MSVLKKVAVTSAVYVATCCLLSASFYLLAVETGSLEFRDQSGAVVEGVVVAPKTALVASLFTGLFAGAFCSAGLPGLWLLVTWNRACSTCRLCWVAALFALVSVGILAGCTAADDHLVLGALWLAASSISMAGVVRLCTSAPTETRNRHPSRSPPL